MYEVNYFSEKSMRRLATCDSRLQILFHKVIKKYDCTILEGHRSSERQMSLFRQGRVQSGVEWMIIDPRHVVTYKDGYANKSNHNYNPSKAVDVAPFPIDWDDIKRFNRFIDYVATVAQELNIEIINGGIFSIKDYVHYELTS